MLFNDDFIQSVEEEPIAGVVNSIKMIFSEVDRVKTDNNSWNEDEHEILWEGASFVELVLQENQIFIDHVFPDAIGDINENCSNLHKYLLFIKGEFGAKSIQIKVESYKGRYKAAFKSAFAYEFSQGDYDRIQVLISELRDEVSNNEKLEEDHQRRLLKRLEALQSELHKRVSDLDKFWGMVGDAGIVLGKLGSDAKPIVDRIKEVAEIVWKTQARTEELPSGAVNPMLGNEPDT